MRARLLRPLAASAAVLPLLVGTAASAAAPSTVEVRPAALERGPDVAVPHVEGRQVVDGGRRIRVDAGYLELLGTSGRAYVVVAARSDEWRGARVLRLRRDGTSTVLLRRVRLGQVTLSGDGARLVRASGVDAGGTRLDVVDARTRARLAGRVVPGAATVLDAEGDRVLLSSWSPARTSVWSTGTDRLRTLVRKPAHAGDLGADRVAWFTKDPYRGGCTVVGAVSDPGERVWRSCQSAVLSWSPDGSRMLTLPKLSDGVGPRSVTLRDADGARLVRYTVARWFTSLGWEDGRTVLLGANGQRRAATVRCVEDSCERASDLRPAQEL